ncbi:MAG: energy-coupling factor transporter transmembrane protein EcfT [Cetobacterium sp.]|uniref:Uncharacterized protein n=1 Tax=Cetobacterium ceti TaxID=180163 RepID=A0A1T4JXM9_9FUSO|nr:hypothetical protein [Cetobacterium ceti]MCJ8343377.1 energy-coupling factor transporter transmembrane protein EcfT [Cetobacterium sp.]SJZ35022.1 hypothetical protein SAMN02745174_00174 [Cetobacterium ceti]
MLLKSSLLILFICNLFSKTLNEVSILFVLGLILNFIYNKNLYKSIKKIKFFLIFYLTTCLVQLFYVQEGEVLFKIYKIYITKEGMVNFGISFLRIFNLLFLSWVVNSQKLFNGRFAGYQQVVENVMDLVPEVFKLFKKKMKIKWFFRHILNQIKVKI